MIQSKFSINLFFIKSLAKYHRRTYFKGETKSSWVPVVLILLYDVISMAGFAPIPWTMTAELFPIEIRGIGHSTVSSVAYVLMAVSIQSYWDLNYICGGIVGVQFFFAVVSLLSALYILVFLPETHGKTLTDITEYFNHHTVFLKCGKKSNKIVLGKEGSESNAERQDQIKNLMLKS